MRDFPFPLFASAWSVPALFDYPADGDKVDGALRDLAGLEIVVDTLFGSMTRALVRGERIEIRGFGSFRVGVRKACQGFNPKTREPIQIPARRKALLRVAKKLRERINHSPVPRSGDVAAEIGSERVE